MDESTKEEHPNLYELLVERLPALGLDGDTYGPYVLGTTEGDEDEVTEVVQLLQASSESHGDQEDVLEDLQKDIMQKMKPNLLL